MANSPAPDRPRVEVDGGEFARGARGEVSVGHLGEALDEFGVDFLLGGVDGGRGGVLRLELRLELRGEGLEVQTFVDILQTLALLIRAGHLRGLLLVSGQRPAIFAPRAGVEGDLHLAADGVREVQFQPARGVVETRPRRLGPEDAERQGATRARTPRTRRPARAPAIECMFRAAAGGGG